MFLLKKLVFQEEKENAPMNKDTKTTEINKLSEIDFVPISKIKTDNPNLRLDSNTESLQRSIEENGLLSPLALDANMNLVFGGRRYSALKALGWSEIPVIVLDIKDLHFELASIDENLERVNYKDRELDQKLYARKQIYEQLYPETKQYSSELASSSSSKRNDNLSLRLPSFTEDTSTQTGESKRTIERAIRREECNSDAVKVARDKNLLTKSHCDELTKLSKLDQEKIVPYVENQSLDHCSHLIKQVKEYGVESVVVNEEKSNQLSKDLNNLPLIIKKLEDLLDRISSSSSTLSGLGVNELEGKLINLVSKTNEFILTTLAD